MQINTEGLVIRERSVGENDRLITVLTRDYGLVKAFANGAKRLKSRSQSATQLLAYSSFVFYQGRDSYTVNDARSIEIFFKLRQDIEKLSLAQYFCELAEELAPEMDAADEYLKLMLNALHFLANDARPGLMLKAIVELRMLGLAGYMPDLTACEACGNFEDTKMYFESQTGILTCDACGGKGSLINPSVLAAMRHICYADFVKLFNFTLPDDAYKALADATEHYLLTQIQKSFKTLDFYKSLKDLK
ncbi:MAG TPA: DNA repair protein RecO [Oscillospiraceae bacterium]|nr:DNA repair protein RecO [Oscillospiraceae bacterium]